MTLATATAFGTAPSTIREYHRHSNASFTFRHTYHYAHHAAGVWRWWARFRLPFFSDALVLTVS